PRTDPTLAFVQRHRLRGGTMPTLRAKKSAKGVRRQPAKAGKPRAALRLLVALDGASARANAPIDTAMALTKAHRATVEALSVVDPMAVAWLTVGVPVAVAGEAALRGLARDGDRYAD